jgi:hypothetical protein
MTSAPFGPSGSDDYFDRHKFNELQKRFDSTANDPKARAALKKELTSKRGPTSVEKLDAKISAAKKPFAKPTTKASVAKKPVPKKPVPKKK